MNILHIASGLGDGGAEAVLYRLCTNDTSNKHIVLSFMDEGKYGSLLKANGIEVYCLNTIRGKIGIKHILKLYSLIKKLKPDVVQTWLYHADFLGGIIAKIAGAKRIVWGVHHTILDPKHSKLKTRLIAKACAILSNFIPNEVVYVARRSQKIHECLGYNMQLSTVIPNGYDLSVFYPDNEARNEIRNEFELGGELIFGMVARFDPFKDHDNLLKAFSLFKAKGFPFKLLLVGTNMTLDNQELMSLIHKEGLVNNVVCLGQRNDIPKIMNALDIHVLSSNSEAFPNVLCEAMACGTPCVSTNVGDASLIIDKMGLIVPVCNPQALSKALVDMVQNWKANNLLWINTKEKARQRVINEFSIEQMVQNYNNTWKNETP